MGTEPRYRKLGITVFAVVVLITFQRDLDQDGVSGRLRIPMEVLASCILGLLAGVILNCCLWPATAHDATEVQLRSCARLLALVHAKLLAGELQGPLLAVLFPSCAPVVSNRGCVGVGVSGYFL